jgi:hypothetical protein
VRERGKRKVGSGVKMPEGGNDRIDIVRTSSGSEGERERATGYPPRAKPTREENGKKGAAPLWREEFWNHSSIDYRSVRKEKGKKNFWNYGTVEPWQ